MLTGTERRLATVGASRAEIDAMKQAWPDWEGRFANASDDMLKAHVERVKPFVPVSIPNEMSRVASAGDDFARAGAAGASALDDVARGGAGVLDDVARGGASMLDDVLRLVGLGGAAAGGAAAAAAASKKNKK